MLTFRLHCALPCLALETPVLLVRRSFNSVRFDPYRDWLHKAKPEQVIGGEFRDFILNPSANPDTYKPVREALIKSITEFIEHTKSETRKASELVRTDYTETEFLRWKNAAMKTSLESYYDEYWYDFRRYNELGRECQQMEKREERLRKELEKEKQKNAELKALFGEDIQKSRAVKLFVRLYKLLRRLRRK